jgi:hypothetical protein
LNCPTYPLSGAPVSPRDPNCAAAPAWASPARSTASIIRSGVTAPHPQPKDRRMRKAAENPCKQRAFPDPPRTATGPVPDPFPSNTPATRAAPATTNLQERLEHPPSKRLGPFRDCTVGPGLPSPPVNAVGASAGRRAGAPALAEARPSRLGGRRSDQSEGKGFGKAGGDHSLVQFPLRENGPSYCRTPIPPSARPGRMRSQ